MKKRLISLLLCLIMAITLFSGFAMADEPPENGWYGNGQFWEESDGNLYECMYYYKDGERVTGWECIEGEWYYFKQHGPYDIGLMFRDAISDEYYLDYDGTMKVNHWRQVLERHVNVIETDNGLYAEYVFKPYDPPRWQYFGEDGKQAYGWEYIDGDWYYFLEGIRGSDNGGGLLVMDDWVKTNGRWYYLGKDGAMLTGWREINGEWYYLKSSGAMDTGWLWDEDAWYYLKSWGGMAADEWEKVNGKWYLFDEAGKMLTGWQGQYYLTSSGAMDTGWGYIDGNWYYFGSDGAMKTGWQKVSGKWYYMDPATGVMQTGWLVDSDGKRYYLSDSGAMVTGTQTIDGVEYIFNRSGALIS